MEETKNIEQLLSQVKSISRSYERLNEANGGNFNIFSVLRIESDEVTTHSRFIAELLNPNGVHGFGDAFLRMFIDWLNIQGLEKMDTLSCKVYPEDYQGKVTGMPKPMGGSIDILIKEPNSDEHVIMIENKIYAGEQEHQLLRYHNAYPKGKLLFLTLWGYESNQESSKSVNYRPVSYEYHIINWLEECRKIAVSNPTLRETLTQYINLIKKLTNQNINTKMNKELAKLFIENKENFDSLAQIQNFNIKKYIIEKSVQPLIQEIGKTHNLEVKGNLFGSWPNFSFENEEMAKKGVKCICFSSSNSRGINDMVYGFLPKDEKNRIIEAEKIIHEKFSEFFKAYNGNGHKNWVTLGYFDPYRNWEDFNTLKKLHFERDEFKNFMEEKVTKMIEIVDDIF